MPGFLPPRRTSGALTARRLSGRSEAGRIRVVRACLAGTGAAWCRDTGPRARAGPAERAEGLWSRHPGPAVPASSRSPGGNVWLWHPPARGRQGGTGPGGHAGAGRERTALAPHDPPSPGRDIALAGQPESSRRVPSAVPSPRHFPSPPPRCLACRLPPASSAPRPPPGLLPALARLRAAGSPAGSLRLARRSRWRSGPPGVQAQASLQSQQHHRVCSPLAGPWGPRSLWSMTDIPWGGMGRGRKVWQSRLFREQGHRGLTRSTQCLAPSWHSRRMVQSI